MSNQFQESIDTFKVKFEGGNSIDAELFTRTINNIIDLVKSSANAIDPNAFLRLEIKATKEGSFETIIDAVAKYTPDLLNRDNARLAMEIVRGFLSFLKIKLHLKGHKPKSIEHQERYSIIKNQDGETITAQKNIVQVYFNDCKIDDTIVNVFTDLERSERNGLLVEHEGKATSFSKENCEKMIVPLVGQDKTITSNQTTETIRECALTIKRPDLIGRSKWQVIFAGQSVDVKIADEDFVNRFREGGIKISSGSKLICDLNIKTDVDEEYNPIQTERTVVKVYRIEDKTEQLYLPMENNDA